MIKKTYQKSTGLTSWLDPESGWEMKIRHYRDIRSEEWFRLYKNGLFVAHGLFHRWRFAYDPSKSFHVTWIVLPEAMALVESALRNFIAFEEARIARQTEQEAQDEVQQIARMEDQARRVLGLDK